MAQNLLNVKFTDHEMRLDYTTNSPPTGQPSFQGFAAPGTATGTKSWTIYKFTYSGTNLVRRELFFKQTWDDRGDL